MQKGITAHMCSNANIKCLSIANYLIIRLSIGGGVNGKSSEAL